MNIQKLYNLINLTDCDQTVRFTIPDDSLAPVLTRGETVLFKPAYNAVSGSTILLQAGNKLMVAVMKKTGGTVAFTDCKTGQHFIVSDEEAVRRPVVILGTVIDRE